MIRKFKSFVPIVPDSCFIFPTAEIIGNVELGENVIIYPGCVIHAEQEKITIGRNTNIQENTSIHVSPGFPASIGSGVTVGHNAILHGCTVSDHVLVGMGAVVQNGNVIGENCMVGAGSVLKRGMEVPAGYIAYGVPARVARPLSPEEREEIRIAEERYQEYRRAFLEDAE